MFATWRYPNAAEMVTPLSFPARGMPTAPPDLQNGALNAQLNLALLKRTKNGFNIAQSSVTLGIFVILC
jgi:hypothetical protein